MSETQQHESTTQPCTRSTRADKILLKINTIIITEVHALRLFHSLSLSYPNKYIHTHTHTYSLIHIEKIVNNWHKLIHTCSCTNTKYFSSHVVEDCNCILCAIKIILLSRKNTLHRNAHGRTARPSGGHYLRQCDPDPRSTHTNIHTFKNQCPLQKKENSKRKLKNTKKM